METKALPCETNTPSIVVALPTEVSGHFEQDLNPIDKNQCNREELTIEDQLFSGPLASANVSYYDVVELPKSFELLAPVKSSEAYPVGVDEYPREQVIPCVAETLHNVPSTIFPVYITSQDGQLSDQNVEPDLGNLVSSRFKKLLRRKLHADVTIDFSSQKLVRLNFIDSTFPEGNQYDNEVDDMNPSTTSAVNKSMTPPRPSRPQTAKRGGRLRRIPRNVSELHQFTGNRTNKNPTTTVQINWDKSHIVKTLPVSNSTDGFEIFSDHASTIIRLKYADVEASEESSENNAVNKSARLKPKKRAIRKTYKTVIHLNPLVNNCNSMSLVKKRRILQNVTDASLLQDCSEPVLNVPQFEDCADVFQDTGTCSPSDCLTVMTTKRSEHFSLITVERQLSPTTVYDQPFQSPSDYNGRPLHLTSLKSNIGTSRTVSAGIQSKLTSKISSAESSDVRCSKRFRIKPAGNISRRELVKKLSARRPENTVTNPKCIERQLALKNFEIQNQIQRMIEKPSASRKVSGLKRRNGPCKKTAQINIVQKKTLTLSSGGRKSEKLTGPASFKRRILRNSHIYGPASFRTKLQNLRNMKYSFAGPFGMRDRQAATSFVCQSHENYSHGWRVLRLMKEPPNKEVVQLDIRWEDLEDTRPIGTECLVLRAMTEDEMEGLLTQVLIASDTITPATSLSSDQKESTYEHIIKSRKTYGTRRGNKEICGKAAESKKNIRSRSGTLQEYAVDLPKNNCKDELDKKTLSKRKRVKI